MASRTSNAGLRCSRAAAVRSVAVESLEHRTLLSTYSLQTLIGLGGNSGLANANGSLLVTSADSVYGTVGRGGVDLSGSIFVLPRGSTQFDSLAYFTGKHGSDPVGGLVMDAAGNLYGTTVYTTSGLAGNNARPTGVFGTGDGTIFELPKGSATITTLATFNGADGQSPEGTLVIDANGNLYGTTRAGGADGDGTVFELPAGSGDILTLATFDQTNGADPVAPLLLDSAGNLFGTTPSGGAGGDGTVFEIPSGGSLTTLASFNGANGATPSGGLVEDAGGDLFGNAAGGGANGEGDIYELSSGSAAITNIASFAGTDGSDPQGQLAIDPAGDLFGTAHLNGAGDDGTAFEIIAASNAITTIAAFSHANGSLPEGLAPDGNGNFYMLTSAGGGYGLGTLDRLLLGGTANTPGYFTAVMGKTTLPAVVVGGVYVDDTVNVGLTDALAINGPVTLRLYLSSDNAIDSASTLVRTYVAGEADKANVTFGISVPIDSLPTTLPSGFYRLLIQATDPLGNIAISNAGPGVEVIAPTVAYSATFSQISLPAQVIGGSSTPARAVIQFANDGNIASQGPVTFALYLSPDGTLANGTPVNTISRDFYIAPGDTASIAVPLFDIPPALSGDDYLVAQISGRTGASTTIVSSAAYSIIPGAAVISAMIDSFQPTTINPASSAHASISITLNNAGNLPAGGAANPFNITLGVTSQDGTQTIPLESFSSAILLNSGKSRTLKLSFMQRIFSSVSAGTWVPTIAINPIAGSPAVTTTGSTTLTVD